MKKNMRVSKIILIFLLIASVKFAGCEQEDLNFFVDCDYCLDVIPKYDTLWVSVTINDENPFVLLEFFIGNYDDGIEDWTDTAFVEEFWLESEVDVKYSVKATYLKDNKPYIAIDGDKLKVVNGEDECYSPCYYLRGGTLDVRIK
jgi:hypothetical protein